MKKWIWILISVVALAAVGWWGITRQQAAATAADTPQTGEIVTAFMGELAASATASGRVEPSRQASLALSTSGIVTHLPVRVGDVVQAGDVLLQLDTADLELALANAQQSLLSAEASLANLQTPPDPLKVAAAEASLASAEANLATLQAGASEQDRIIAEADVRSAEANLYSASAQLQNTRTSISEADRLAATARLERARLNLEQIEERTAEFSNQQLHDQLVAAQNEYAQAQANYDSVMAGADPNAVNASAADVSANAARVENAETALDSLLAPPTAQEIASAQVQVAQAQLNLENLLAGSSAAQLEVAEAQVAQAQLNVANAEADLASATLTAPFEGLVTAVHVAEGEVASGVVIELIDKSSLEVVLSVDEVDIGRLQIGQPALITLEAWPEVEMESELLRIAPQANSSTSGITSYDVYLSLPATELPLLLGMTANAQLITAELDEVLLVPNAAIAADRAANQYSVTRVLGETTETVIVGIGLQDENYTQITSGLNAGDQLLIGNVLPVFQFGPGE